MMILLVLVITLVHQVQTNSGYLGLCRPTNSCLDCLKEGVRNWYCGINGSWCLPVEEDPPDGDYGFVAYYPSKICPRELPTGGKEREGGSYSGWWVVATTVFGILFIIVLFIITGVLVNMGALL